MFGNTNTSTSFWNNSNQQNTGLSNSFSTLGNADQKSNFSFGGFGMNNTSSTQNTGVQSTSFGNPSQSNIFGSTQNNMFGQSNTMGGSTLFANTNQSSDLSGSNTSNMSQQQGTTGSGLFGSTVFGENKQAGSFYQTNANQLQAGFKQITGNEVANPSTFDGSTISNVAYGTTNSQDEYRWAYYKKNDASLGGIGGGGSVSSTTPNLFGSNTGTNLFGTTTQTGTGSGLFGSTTSTTGTGSNLFGGTTQTGTTGTGLFGSTNTGMGTSTSSGLFGSTTGTAAGSNLFGANTQTGATGTGLFPSTSTGLGTSTGTGLFGSTTQGVGSNTGSNLFGSTTQTGTGTGLFGSNTGTTTGSNLFGSNTSTTTAGTGLFGATNTGLGTTGSGLFGSTTGQTTTSGSNLFGSTTQTGTTGTGLFGSTNTGMGTSTSSGLFGSTTGTTPGTTTSGTGLFGSTTQTGTTGTGLFGSTTGTAAGSNLFGSTNALGTSTGSNILNQMQGVGSNTSGGLFSGLGTTQSSGYGRSYSTGLGSSLGTSGISGPTYQSSFGGGLGATMGTQLNSFGTQQGMGFQQGQMQPYMNKVGCLHLWDLTSPSPGLSSFWSPNTELPPEAKEYLQRLYTVNKERADQVNGAMTAHLSNPNLFDRFGLRRVLVDVGEDMPRYFIDTRGDDPSKHYDEMFYAQNKESHVRGSVGMSRFNMDPSLHDPAVRNRLKRDEKSRDAEVLTFYGKGGQIKSLKDVNGNTNGTYTNHVWEQDEPGMLPGTYVTNGERNGLDPIYITKIDEEQLESEDTNGGRNRVKSVRINPEVQVEEGRAPSDKVPVLTRKGYATNPSISCLRDMTESQLAKVMDFRVMHEEWGDIVWPGYTDVRGMNLDEIVDIERHKVTLYARTAEVPPVGTKLNKPAVITMYKCTPKDYNERSITTTIKHMEKLKELTEKNGCKFISANLASGVWVFETPYFADTERRPGRASRHFEFANSPI